MLGFSSCIWFLHVPNALDFLFTKFMYQCFCIIQELLQIYDCYSVFVFGFFGNCVLESKHSLPLCFSCLVITLGDGITSYCVELWTRDQLNKTETQRCICNNLIFWFAGLRGIVGKSLPVGWQKLMQREWLVMPTREKWFISRYWRKVSFGLIVHLMIERQHFLASLLLMPKLGKLRWGVKEFLPISLILSAVKDSRLFNLRFSSFFHFYFVAVFVWYLFLELCLHIRNIEQWTCWKLSWLVGCYFSLSFSLEIRSGSRRTLD